MNRAMDAVDGDRIYLWAGDTSTEAGADGRNFSIFIGRLETLRSGSNVQSKELDSIEPIAQHCIAAIRVSSYILSIISPIIS